jgi:hypothetical protein
MKLEVEVEQVLERLARDCADSALADVREHCVQQLAKKRRAYSRCAV